MLIQTNKLTKINKLENIWFNTIPEAIEDIKAGKMIIVVDDEDRENEGDFLMAGEKATTEAINFMVKEGRGLVCAPISKPVAKRFKLNNMVMQGADPDEANFTISIDHKRLTTTEFLLQIVHTRFENLQISSQKPVIFGVLVMFFHLLG